ncbi:ABC transporter permease [Anaerosporobacter faecicola]|uniref:ABC transporter permease n=1 Tax=Anaerosporobacter faecicola TaxID=2718714 RepID=UPI00143B9EE2|nr:ABC transporter permease [Anaerosporobacter faecicola]
MNKYVKYIVTTLLRMVLLLIGVSIVCFMLITSSPIDPVEAYVGSESNISQEQKDVIAEYWGLNNPPVQRYVTWVKNLLHGDMGISIAYQKPVTQILAQRFQTSAVLMITAWILSGIIGFLIGIVAGSHAGSVLDRVLKTFCFILSSTPAFWIGLLLLAVCSVQLGWFPVGFAVPVGKAASEVTVLDRIHHLILPALTLSITGISNIALHTRQKLIDVLHSDYVLFAKARGESAFQIIKRHGLRNIAIPALTLQFASFSELFGGSVLAEQVFSYPGLGNAATTAGLKGDVPLLLGVALFSVLFVFAGNFMANLLYGVLNPQIRKGEGQ